MLACSLNNGKTETGRLHGERMALLVVLLRFAWHSVFDGAYFARFGQTIMEF